MRAVALIVLLALGGLLAGPAGALESKQTRLYDQISKLGIAPATAEWLAEEAAKAGVKAIRIGNTNGSYGLSQSGGKITLQDSAGGGAAFETSPTRSRILARTLVGMIAAGSDT
jgi:hypothetical protein